MDTENNLDDTTTITRFQIVKGADVLVTLVVAALDVAMDTPELDSFEYSLLFLVAQHLSQQVEATVEAIFDKIDPSDSTTRHFLADAIRRFAETEVLPVCAHDAFRMFIFAHEVWPELSSANTE